jgi:iron complex transport system substrate-binding protein
MNRQLKLLIILITYSAQTTAHAVPHRIVSQTLASDEMILELKRENLGEFIGISSLAVNREYSNIAAQVEKLKIPQVGNELEHLVTLKPDLVILASYNRVELLNLLKSARIPTLVLKDFGSIDDILGNIGILGKALGEEKHADAMRASMVERLKKLKSPAVKPKVLSFNADHSIAGVGTLFDAAVTRAGGENLARTLGIKNFQQLSLEQLVVLKPDWVIAASMPHDKDEIAIARIQNSPGWKEIPAVKAGRIILIPSRLLFTASHYIADLVEMMNQRFYAAK